MSDPASMDGPVGGRQEDALSDEDALLPDTAPTPAGALEPDAFTNSNATASQEAIQGAPDGHEAASEDSPWAAGS